MPAPQTPSGPHHPRVQVLPAREVPLGGPRAMSVRRVLPARERSFVGAWCFVDHYGPDEVASTGGMHVPPHPHCGLQTVSWLFAGEIEHHDSGGAHAHVRPGEVNLMTGGRGIAHSEVSTPATSTLHGVQLWVVLPERDRALDREFQTHAIPEVRPAPGVTGRVFIGRLAGGHGSAPSPVRTRTPLLGAELRLAAGTTWRMPVDPAFEHALLVDHGEVTLAGQPIGRGDLGVVDAGPDTLTLHAASEALVVLLGGPPFEEAVVLWWNFVARSHDEIVAAREEWNTAAGHGRFGTVDGHRAGGGHPDWLPAPALPAVRLKPRRRVP